LGERRGEGPRVAPADGGPDSLECLAGKFLERPALRLRRRYPHDGSLHLGRRGDGRDAVLQLGEPVGDPPLQAGDGAGLVARVLFDAELGRYGST
jgi:hypothetical protein